MYIDYILVLKECGSKIEPLLHMKKAVINKLCV